MRKVTLKDFISRANKVHNFFYDYSKFIYTKSIYKSIIICPLHGEFEQNAHSHLQGKGCRKCSDKRRVIEQGSFEKFLEKANKKFQKKYTYFKNKFTDWYTKTEILCSVHGIFNISPRFHLQSNGCPKCAFNKIKGGYNITNAEINKEKWLHIDSIVYLIDLKKDKESFLKVGITTNQDVRYRFYTIPYEIKILKLLYTNLYDAVYIENNILTNLTDYVYLPKINFKGYTECFKVQSEEHLNYIKSLV